MEEKNKKIFKTSNDLKVNVTKINGEVVIDEECCTMVSIIMKNTGEIGASFFGAHNPDVIKVLEKSLKTYFKGIKKELKKRYKSDEDEIKVVASDLPEEDKWNVEKVPATKVSPAQKNTENKSNNNSKSKPKSSNSKNPKSTKSTTKSKSNINKVK